MRVLVAGASGAIGRPLLAQLLAAGHEVTGTTRSGQSAEAIRAAGARAAVYIGKARGVYNVVDDDPAAPGEWLPGSVPHRPAPHDRQRTG
jgi:nucleoside-diphosphate-sugar epimerase